MNRKFIAIIGSADEFRRIKQAMFNKHGQIDIGPYTIINVNSPARLSGFELLDYCTVHGADPKTVEIAKALKRQ